MVHFIPLKDDLLSSFTDFLTEKYKNNFTGAAVIFPTRRIQYFLLGKLADKFKSDFMPPGMYTVDDFFEKLLKETHPGFTKLTEIEACYTVYKILKNHSLDFINRDTGFLANFPWTLKILSAVETLLTEAADIKPPLKEFKDFVRLGSYSREYQILIEILPEITQEFVQLLTAERKYTRGTAYRTVAELAEKGTLTLREENYYFLGFHSLNHCEKMLFRYILKNHSSHLFLYTDNGALKNETAPFHLQQKTLKYLNIEAVIPPSSQEEWNNFLKVEIHEIPDTETEIALAADIFLKSLDKKSPDQYIKTALILPDPSSLIPLIHGLVSKTEGIPFNISLQYPFNRTALFKLIDSILSLPENRNGNSFRAMDYLNIIRHPYIKLLDRTETGILKSAIHIIENSILKNNLSEVKIPKIIANLKERGFELKADDTEEMLELVRNIHNKFIFSGTMQFREILNFLNNALKEISLIKNNYLFLNEYLVFAFETVAEIRETAERFDFEHNIKIQDAADFIRYYFSQKQVPFEGSPLKGIQILGMLETRGLKFNDVYIFDNVEGVLPQNRKYDSILPYDIKKIFGLRNYIEWEKLFSYNFYSLIGSADHVHLFYPVSKDGERVSRSRYIEYILYKLEEQSGREVKVSMVNTSFSLHAKKIQSIEKNSSLIDACRRTALSPSSVKDYLTCPKKFYYRKILKIEEPEELQPEIAPNIQGSIIHAVLKDILELWNMGKLSVEELLETKLKDSVAYQFGLNGFNTEQGINRLRAWGVIKQLKKFLFSEFKRLKTENTRIFALEYDLKITIKLDKGAFLLSGRADRIDKKPEGYRIIDYKTGSTFPLKIKENKQEIFTESLKSRLDTGFKDIKNIQNFYNAFLEAFPYFQLLLYGIMFSAETDLPPSGIDGEYIFVQEPAQDKWRQDIFTNVSADIREKTLENIMIGLKFVVADILSPEIPFYTATNINTCKNCPYSSICKK